MLLKSVQTFKKTSNYEIFFYEKSPYRLIFLILYDFNLHKLSKIIRDKNQSSITWDIFILNQFHYSPSRLAMDLFFPFGSPFILFWLCPLVLAVAREASGHFGDDFRAIEEVWVSRLLIAVVVIITELVQLRIRPQVADAFLAKEIGHFFRWLGQFKEPFEKESFGSIVVLQSFYQVQEQVQSLVDQQPPKAFQQSGVGLGGELRFIAQVFAEKNWFLIEIQSLLPLDYSVNAVFLALAG